MIAERTPPKKKAQQLSKHLRHERPDYVYLKKLFYHLCSELEIEVPAKPKRLPTVPKEEEIQRFYNAVFQSKRFGDLVIIKTFLYTGVRVGEIERSMGIMIYTSLGPGRRQGANHITIASRACFSLSSMTIPKTMQIIFIAFGVIWTMISAWIGSVCTMKRGIIIES